jgi:F-type H+-transporting ATPase subunit b
VNHLLAARLFASSISVDFDATFIAQFILFTAFILVLRPLLFDPLLKVFAERTRRTKGARDKAAELDAKLDKVRVEANSEREKLRREAKEIEAKIMAEARTDVNRILENGKARIAAEVEQMKKDLAEAQPAHAAEIASRVLGREVGR